MTDTTTDLASLQADLAAATADLGITRDDNARLRAHLDSLQAAHDSLAAQLEAARNDLAEVTAQRDAAFAQLEPHAPEHIDLSSVEVPADYVPTAAEVASAGVRNGMSDDVIRAACWIRHHLG